MAVAATQVETAPPVLDIRGLVKRFGPVDVLKGIDVAAAPGDFLVLVGPSGCGKSTLLNCIAGLEEVSAGTIHIGGRDVTEVPPRDRNIAMVFQSYALYPTMTVGENIAFGMKIRGVPKREQEQKIAEVAALLQIGELVDRKPAQLSGGQRQRVAMGRALVREPILFLFDEPLSNLDAKLRVEMRGEIKRLHQTMNASIVYVTHDQIEAMTLGTRIVVLKDGAIQQVGAPAEIYEHPANLFVADFMGSPPMNLVPARCTIGADGATLRFGPGDQGPEITDPAAVKALSGHNGRDVIVGLRPEAFGAVAPKKAIMTLNVSTMENSGSDHFAVFALGNGSVTARLPGRLPIEAGQNVPLSLDLDTVCYFDPVSELRIV